MTQATPSTAHATHPTADRRTPTPPAAASPHAGTLTLAARGVAAEYPGRPPVLTCADIDLTRGARLALLGANGSGKTTLLRVLAGAHRPSGGRVELPGSGHGATEVLRYDRRALRHHRSRVQLVLQDPDDQLFSADVRQDVSFGPLNQGLPETEVRARVVEALRLLGIEHLADRPTHHLSYGERKRVATAGAVAMRPEVLLLDEPAAGLDPAGVAELLSALDRLEHAGTTIALATHDVELALAWADEVAVVIGGRVVQGPAVQLLGDEDLLARARLRRPWPLALAAGLGLATRPRTLAEVITALSAPNPTAGAPTPTASAPTEAQPCEVSR